MTLMMTSAQVVETSVNVTNNSPSRDYSHPDDQTTQTTETPEFKPFTVFFETLSKLHKLGQNRVYSAFSHDLENRKRAVFSFSGPVTRSIRGSL